MIQIERLHFDGRVKSMNGIRYRYSRKSHSFAFYGVSFLVDTIRCKKKSIKVTMHADVNHERAHIHVGEHEASFDIQDGSLIVGECDNRVRKDVQKWIGNHREDLLQLWEIIKDGRDREYIISRIRGE